MRMSLRTAILVGLIALPTLALKDPTFLGVSQYSGFSMVFAALGAFVLPMWIPLLGQVVVTFTLVLPIGLAGIWLAYALFAAFPNIIFMMLMCVVLGAGVFFVAEYLSLPVGLFSVLPTVFIVGACTYVQMAPKAWFVTVVVTILLFLAAIVATLVCAFIFPEYCVDEVFRHHHEALEHLLHLSYHAMGLNPPALLKRHYSSAARGVGAGKWKRAFRDADELPSSLQALGMGEATTPLLRVAGSEAWQENSLLGPEASTVTSFASQSLAPMAKPHVTMECSWHRVAVSCQAGAAAQMGASAEVVLMAAHHKRIILPCSPLIPCAKGQIDTEGLLALRHLALRTALHIMKIYYSMQPIDAATGYLLQQLLSEREWSAMRSSLLAALQELVDVFPMDYYPAGSAPDRQHLASLQGAVNALKGAWQKTAPALKQQQQQRSVPQLGSSTAAGPQVGGDGEQQGAAAAADHAAVTLAAQGQHEPAAAAAVFKDPLVLEGSPATQVLARMNTIHLIKLLEDLVLLLEQLYDTVEQVGEHMVSCRCC